MLFNSYEFIFAFLPVMFLGYFWLTHKKLILGSKLWLVGGSLFFYGYWNIAYVPLLLGSILVNFVIGSLLANSPRMTQLFSFLKAVKPKALLALGIIFNVSLLAYFKYTDFLLDNVNTLIGSDIPLPHIILPLGMSFLPLPRSLF